MIIHTRASDDAGLQHRCRESRRMCKQSLTENTYVSNSKLESGCTCMTDGVWMTKAELAAARSISVGSADRLIRQRRWKRQPGDDGGTRVLVPRRWAEGRVSSIAATPAALVQPGSETTIECDGRVVIVDALQGELIRLRTEIATAQSARIRVEFERDEERQGRKAAERALSDAQRKAEQAMEMAEALRREKETRVAEERAEQITREATSAQLRRLVEAMAARRALGLWTRLRLAWRGE